MEKETKARLKKMLLKNPQITSYSFFSKYFAKDWNYSTVKSFINEKSKTASIPNIDGFAAKCTDILNALGRFE